MPSGIIFDTLIVVPVTCTKELLLGALKYSVVPPILSVAVTEKLSDSVSPKLPFDMDNVGFILSKEILTGSQAFPAPSTQ